MATHESIKVPDLSGRLHVVTGANSGLGLAMAHFLAVRGGSVVLACRSAANAEKTRQDILHVAPGAELHAMTLDVASLQSVRTFAESMQRRFTTLDVLINNAGIMATPRALSADGFELQFATNHLGHFALTGPVSYTHLTLPTTDLV